MEKLLKDLVWKCFDNNLSIDLDSTNYGSVTVWDYTEEKAITVSEGSLKNWISEEPRETLNRMHKEVDAYINSFQPIESYEGEETEYARAALTEYERKLKESGHKESDFR